LLKPVKLIKKELREDLNGSNYPNLPEDQHCQRRGQVKHTVTESAINGLEYLCDKCLTLEVSEIG